MADIPIEKVDNAPLGMFVYAGATLYLEEGHKVETSKAWCQRIFYSASLAMSQYPLARSGTSDLTEERVQKVVWTSHYISLGCLYTTI